MFFKVVNNLEELKVEYKKLAMLHHPDRGGNTKDMQDVNAEYEKLFKQLKNEYNTNPETKYQKNETMEMYRDFINSIIALDLTLEICGTWIYIWGVKQDDKDLHKVLKSHKCKFASSKKCWYWRAEEYKSKYRGKSTMDLIRSKFGSDFIKPTPPTRPLMN